MHSVHPFVAREEDCMRNGKRIFTILFAAVLVAMLPLRLSATSLSDAQKEKEALERELENAQALVEELKNSKNNVEEKVRQLDYRLTEIEGRILALEKQLEEKGDQIEFTKEELEEAQNDVTKQYERMKSRIKYMYENSSSMSMLEVLLTSGSIVDFINQLEYIRQIMDYDREMLDKYHAAQQLVTDTKELLEQEYAQLEELRGQVQTEREAVQVLLSAKEDELSGISGELTDAQETADAVAAEIEAQNQMIAQIQELERKKEEERKRREEEERKRQEQLANGQLSENEGSGNLPGDVYDGGAFLWPVPSSTRVTSDYGSRLSPTAGASSNHKGIDVGASYGAKIIAVADGTVAFAGYNNGMGNYVMLSHGSGLYTVYGHCSALTVSTGEDVAAGQTIAQIGSTGISTGNHLHFGVTKDGVYVSPWNYLSK